MAMPTALKQAGLGHRAQRPLLCGARSICKQLAAAKVVSRGAKAISLTKGMRVRAEGPQVRQPTPPALYCSMSLSQPNLTCQQTGTPCITGLCLPWTLCSLGGSRGGSWQPRACIEA